MIIGNLSRTKLAATALLLYAASTSCDPVGEPIVLPELYNSGRILEPDAAYMRLDCDQSAQLPGTLALYCFDDDPTAGSAVGDSTGKHGATVVCTKTRRVRGPTCCGMALQFSETNTSAYIEIADSPDWKLKQGSISFWLRLEACPSQEEGQSLISRASSDQAEAGHFNLTILKECNWSVRLTRNGKSVEKRADAPLTPGQWSHLNVNFGPPGLELYLDAKLAAEDPVSWGIDGNHAPWVVGADTRDAKPATVALPAHFLTGAAVDLLRISSIRNKLAPLD
jgi:hypothetical protein